MNYESIAIKVILLFEIFERIVDRKRKGKDTTSLEARRKKIAQSLTLADKKYQDAKEKLDNAKASLERAKEKKEALAQDLSAKDDFELHFMIRPNRTMIPVVSTREEVPAKGSVVVGSNHMMFVVAMLVGSVCIFLEKRRRDKK